MPIVYPSGAALATSAVPRLPPAPGRFSTTTGAPSAGASFSESTRAIKSGELPAGKGTIRWIARDGQVFTSVGAGCAQTLAAQTSATARTESRLFETMRALIRSGNDTAR